MPLWQKFGDLEDPGVTRKLWTLQNDCSTTAKYSRNSTKLTQLRLIPNRKRPGQDVSLLKNSKDIASLGGSPSC
jgi:hypothetical protein